ncbi:MAG: P-loop NTPase [Nitrospiraceae bacterium]|nr:P-loop NTPase [Nitrospiraceae bacterium]
MRIAVASGKGGTGKTTIAVNLATIACRHGGRVAYVDCDVEEPNGHVFLKPEFSTANAVGVPTPQVDADRCTLCGACGDICRFSAIVCIGTQVFVSPELCHGCGGCALVCPSEAISEVERHMGTVQIGRAGALDFVQGTLNVGEAMSPPVIRAAKQAAPESALVILDAPPGTSCPVITSIRDADYVVMVTEPTPFGLNDLKLAVDIVRELALPFGVVVNRAGVGDDRVEHYCRAESIPILAEIPDDERIARAYSRGALVCDALPEYTALFEDLLKSIQSRASCRGEALPPKDEETCACLG